MENDHETHFIRASAGDGGSIYPFGNAPVTIEGDMRFTMLPDPGFRVRDVIADGVSVGAVERYIFENVTFDDHTIHVEFERIPDTPLTGAPQTSDNRSVVLPIAAIGLGMFLIAGAELYRRRLKKTTKKMD